MHLKKTSYTTVSFNIYIYFFGHVCFVHAVSTVLNTTAWYFKTKKSDFPTPQKAPQLSFAFHSGKYCMWGRTPVNTNDVPKIWAFENA